MFVQGEERLVHRPAGIRESHDEILDIAPIDHRDEHGSLPVDIHRQACGLGRLTPARSLPRFLDGATLIAEHVAVQALPDENVDGLAVAVGEPGIDDDLPALGLHQRRKLR